MPRRKRSLEDKLRSRRSRRVLLVLLTGAGKLSGFPVGKAAQVSSGYTYVVLARLERLGWAASDWEQNPPAGQPGRRRFYQLTRYGRAMALKLLGLENDHV